MTRRTRVRVTVLLSTLCQLAIVIFLRVKARFTLAYSVIPVLPNAVRVLNIQTVASQTRVFFRPQRKECVNYLENMLSEVRIRLPMGCLKITIRILNTKCRFRITCSHLLGCCQIWTIPPSGIKVAWIKNMLHSPEWHKDSNPVWAAHSYFGTDSDSSPSCSHRVVRSRHSRSHLHNDTRRYHYMCTHHYLTRNQACKVVSTLGQILKLQIKLLISGTGACSWHRAN